jgi:hypothetical protein
MMKRVFSEQEVAEVVKRAIVLQEQEHETAYTPGITKDELLRVAQDLGIDIKYVEAALQMGRPSETKRGPLNLTAAYERVVDAELDPANFDVIMEELKPLNGRQGVLQVGRMLSGAIWTGWGSGHASISSRNGRTKIEIKSNPLISFMMTLYPAALLAIGLGAAIGEGGAPLVGFGVAVGVLAMGAAAFGGVLRRSHESARKLVDKLVEKVVAETSVQEERLMRSGQTAQVEEGEHVQNLTGGAG